MGGLSFELRVTAPHLCLITVAGLIDGLRPIEDAGKLTPAGRRTILRAGHHLSLEEANVRNI